MGLLRLWLALCVATTHAGPIFGLKMLRGDLAVASFFGLAGFLSALVIEGRYKGRYGTFYLARALRIWPVYWIALGLAASVMLWSYFFGPHVTGSMYHWTLVEKFPAQPWLSLFGLSQAFIVGQDLSWFAGIRPDGSLEWACDPDSIMSFYALNLLPQAWTLALEEYYYLLAPWLTRLRFWGAALATLAGVALGAAISPRCARLPLGFFPTALPFFLAGIFAYRLYQSLERRPWPRAWESCALLFFAASLLALPYSSLGSSHYAVLLLTVFGLPFVFKRFRDLAWDRALGDLSYPFYLVHFPMLWACIVYQAKLPQGLPVVYVVVPVSLILSYALLVLIERPVSAVRRGLLKQNA